MPDRTRSALGRNAGRERAIARAPPRGSRPEERSVAPTLEADADERRPTTHSRGTRSTPSRHRLDASVTPASHRPPVNSMAWSTARDPTSHRQSRELSDRCARPLRRHAYNDERPPTLVPPGPLHPPQPSRYTTLVCPKPAPAIARDLDRLASLSGCAHARPQPSPPARRTSPVRVDAATVADHDRARSDSTASCTTSPSATTGTRIILLVADLDVRIIHAATGEILRQLTIDPTRRYHGTGRPPDPTPRKRQRPKP